MIESRNLYLAGLAGTVATTVLLAACGGSAEDTTATANTAETAARIAATPTEEAEAASFDPSTTAVDDSSSTTAAATGSQRETAQAVTYAKPKVGTQDFQWDTTVARQKELAKYGMAIIDKGRLRGAAAYNTFAAGVKAANPNTLIGQYTALAEVPCPGTSKANSTEYAAMVTMAKNSGFYVKSNPGNGYVQWTTTYGHCDMNVTQWGVKNGAGQTWAQYKWMLDKAAFFGNTPKMDIMFVDNVFETYRTAADYRRVGKNQPTSDASTQAAYRAGQVNFFNIARGQIPNLRIIGGGTLSLPEYKGQINGAFLEALIGKSWSTETLKGWSGMMARYRDAMANARAPKMVMFHMFGLPGDYKSMRYGLASALMDDGYFFWAAKTASGGTASPMKPYWFDEYDAQIGTAIDPPQTAPKQNGIYYRRFQNGIVVLNPQNFTATITTLPAGYKRIAGTQDRGTNNGAGQGTTLTMAAKSGLVLIKN